MIRTLVRLSVVGALVVVLAESALAQDSAWPEYDLVYVNDDGAEETLHLPLTIADWAATEGLEAGRPLKPGIFIVDPIGNLVFWYPISDAGKPVLDDLRRLLKLSQIG